MRQLLLSIVLLWGPPAMAAGQFEIGSGGVSGTYFPTIEAICSLVNQYQKSKFECQVVPTEGSVANIHAVVEGRQQFAIVQDDVLHHAYHGKKMYEGKPQESLRAVLALYPELMALVVRADSGIETLRDLEGKRINLDSVGSGTDTTARELLRAAEFDLDKLALAGSLKAEQCPDALGKKEIDGYFYMVGHPAKNITRAAEATPIRLLMLDGAPVYSLLEKYPYYTTGTIAKNTYPGVEEDTPSIGVDATLITAADAPTALVETVLSTLLDHFDEFRQRHPEPALVSKESLVKGLSAPLHPAAAAYYKKIGLK